MIKINTVNARNQFSTIINQVAFGKQRIVLTRRGQKIVALVPMEDMEILEQLGKPRGKKIRKDKQKEQ